MKYTETMIVFSEIPNHITLDINISNCPHHCTECHSPWLRENIGTELTEDNLCKLIDKNKGIDCVLLSGGDADHKSILSLAKFIKTKYPDILTAWYSGDDDIDEEIWNSKVLDFYKVGSYKKEYGPLKSKTTNQKLYELNKRNNNYVDVTYRFWKSDNDS